jgi:hypothetical protein
MPPSGVFFLFFKNKLLVMNVYVLLFMYYKMFDFLDYISYLYGMRIILVMFINYVRNFIIIYISEH